jgi:hypothetical protein
VEVFVGKFFDRERMKFERRSETEIAETHQFSL